MYLSMYTTVAVDLKLLPHPTFTQYLAGHDAKHKSPPKIQINVKNVNYKIKVISHDVDVIRYFTVWSCH